MLLPSIFNSNRNNLSLFDFDNFMNDFPSFPEFTGIGRHIMKTDVQEHDDRYELDIDLPGFKKDEINLELENGYLTVSAQRKEEKKEDGNNGKYIRQERVASAARSFYVGEATEEDIKARFDNGVLHLNVPKKEKALSEKKFIAIEGPSEAQIPEKTEETKE